jgi:hypothetical protein
MKHIITIIFVLFLAGCDADRPESIPLNTVDRAKELCASMDGIKKLKVETDCIRNGKVCSNTLITTINVVCNKHNAKISTEIEWEVVYD